MKRKDFYYTQEETAEILSITPGAVSNAIRRDDLKGVRPKLFIEIDGEKVELKGVSLSKDLVEKESVLNYKKVMTKRRKTGRLGRPKKGNVVRIFIMDGFKSNLPEGITEGINKKEEPFPWDFSFDMCNESQVAKALGVGRTVLRARLESGKEVLKGIHVERVEE